MGASSTTPQSTSTNKNEPSPSETSTENEKDEEYDKKQSLLNIFYFFTYNLQLFVFSVLKKKLWIQSKKHFGGAFVNITHSTVHVPTIIYSLSKF